MKKHDQIHSLKKGQVITANHLNRMAAQINGNTDAIRRPYQKSIETGSTGGLSDLTFTETSRSSTTATLTDSAGDTVDVDQIDEVVLENSSGDVLTLIFTNP